MKNFVLPLLLFSLTGCQVVDNIRERLPFLKPKAPAARTDEPKEFEPLPPVAMEQDKIIQISGRERLISVLEQFNRSPDETLLGVVLTEFEKNKDQFSTTLDPALKTELNRAIPNIQQGSSLAIAGYARILSFLVGENKDHLRNVLSRAFDVAPLELAKRMVERGEDKLCNMAGLIPPEVESESRRNFLETRLATILAAKSMGDARSNIYLDQCERTIRLALSPDGVSPDAVAVPPAPAETNPDATVESPAVSAPASTAEPPTPAP